MDVITAGALHLGAVGLEVLTLQQKLNQYGASLTTDGLFGPATEAAVMAFQRDSSLVIDGIVGSKTWMTLLRGASDDRLLRESDLMAAALELDVDLAAVKAVNEVESRDIGFLATGQPSILFERHVMHNQLVLRASSDESKQQVDELTTLHPNLVNPKPGGYAGGAPEHQRLKRARMIDDTAALCSTSWGLFQIMGYHWDRLGYTSVQDYAEAMSASERNQLTAFVAFIRADKRLHRTLRAHQWSRFARIYNGPAYKRNFYDTRLARAYERHTALLETEDKAALA